MIKVCIKRNIDRSISEFKVIGHAYADEPGKDIVCAAVSMLTQTIVLGLCQVIKIKVSYEITEGLLYCKIPNDLSQQHREQTNNLLETMVLGIKNIQESYSEYIIVHDKEV